MSTKCTPLLDFVSLEKLCPAEPNNCEDEGILFLGIVGDFIPVNGDDPGRSLMSGLAGFSVACFAGTSETPAECKINGQAIIRVLL